MAGFVFDSQEGENIVWIGGGSNKFNSATQIRFATASTSTNQGTNNPDNVKMVINASGNVGIGTTKPDTDALLTVAGSINSKEIKVHIDAGEGPDYVFEPGYKLRTLRETKEYIAKNKHLPEVPKATEMEAEGVDLGTMNMVLLKKIEELTLYQIELLERIELLESEVGKN